ncbi:MAG TPA: energy transducer TonB [Methylomirabilota bacterium]|nr:energy transducer TonB [Methylomirabilota bacterium]
MRKVYQVEKSTTGIAMAVLLGVAITGVLFAIIPFSHIIAKPKSLVQLTTARTIEVPPKVDNEPPPPAPEPEQKEEAPPELKLAEAPQQITINADLEIATGSGGGLAGFGEMQKLASADAVRNDVVDVSDLERRPEPVSQIAPAYPPELRKAKIEGAVTLLFLLSEDGRVEEARVENSSRPEFEKPALEAIRKWRFRPGTKDGQPVRTYLRIPMRFRVTSN